MEFIPVYQPSLTGNEKKYVNECLDTSWISAKGKFVEQFETAFSKYIGADHAITVANGTVALHLALIALGIGRGDEVIVPTLTYVA
ncbi:aminotransferase class I/II-fold pyridoxal phosphate-dependent enzyme, partial [uncultured Selenomonas sp.]|uniref:aminotransferase class I/II-fold pyridoxal phosphate-dependent enzyme n=1 Tax=uncultured Selenomonas sp. TaxID=159275 RepID=UPI0028D67A4C